MSIVQDFANTLSLLEIDGPFLSLNTLKNAFPLGYDQLDQADLSLLRLAHEEWLDAVASAKPNPELHNAWLQWVIHKLLALPKESMLAFANLPSDLAERLRIHVPEHATWLQADFVIGNPATENSAFEPRILLCWLPAKEALNKPLKQDWPASHASRMAYMLRESKIPLGLLSNGKQWMLVNRPTDLDATSGFATWHSDIWFEEQITLRAFRSLLGKRRLFGVPREQSLEAMFSNSLDERQEVTVQLGKQVKDAVQVLVKAFDQQARERQSLPDNIEPKRLYEAALTVMMRMVFLLFAEEQRLLPLGEELYDHNYALSSMLDELLAAADQQTEDVLDRRFDAWARLLATFRMIYAGSEHDRLNLPAYGGSLFDPDRFPFLEGRPDGSTWRNDQAEPLTISNRTVLHLLQALQTLPSGIKGESSSRRLSFRSLDIEQIGHVYETLLDYTAKRADRVLLGINAKSNQQIEIALDELEQQTPAERINWLAKQSELTAKTLEKQLNATLEPQQADQLRAAAGNDPALFARLRPWAGIIRRDTYQNPDVILPGSVYTTSGSQRRSTGTHYTPRSLTEPIVTHTLEPLVYIGPAEGLPREQWQLQPAPKLLQLSICDMAMGSGAFLVQACRYLAERLLEAWEQAEQKHPDRWIGQDGFETNDYAKALPTDAEERMILARRLVADRCLYGVDANPLATEMAKLSLWLITFAKGRPFSFLDHALRAGDSLLGISRHEQLSYWSLNWRESELEQNQVTLITQQVQQALKKAAAERKRIANTPVLEARDSSNKAGWLATAEAATELVRLGADLLVAAELHPNPKQRNGLRLEWLTKFSLLLSSAEITKLQTQQGQLHAVEAYKALRDSADATLAGKRPFHWPLEFPELFYRQDVSLEDLLAQARSNQLSAETDHSHTGFYAFVGNPPFIGGKKIMGALDDPYGQYRDYLVNYIGNSVKGSADLCAYFFLRAHSLLRPQGMAGLIATNTIAQGDSREVGLDQITADTGTIIRAVPSRTWPGAAAVVVAHVYWRKGNWQGQAVLNEQPVTAINTYLTKPGRTVGNPYKLNANAGKSFIGSYVLGMGFVLEPAEAQALITKDARNREALFPYMNGEDLNKNPKQLPSRWVINFQDWPLEKAQTFPDLMKIVEEKVKPDRKALGLKQEASAKGYARFWWQYAHKGMELYSNIAKMQRVLIRSRVSNTHAPIFVSTDMVYSETSVVFAFDQYEYFSCIQSNVHELWAREYASTMKNDLRYSPTDVFSTFPFPTNLDGLEAIGEQYYQHRQQIMQERQEGLTKTYNRFHNPAEQDAAIIALRDLHRQMDEAVAAAYGWGDLALEHGFHQTKQGMRYTMSEAARQEVLDRLLELNHARYAEEVAQGLHDKGAGKGKAKGKAKAKAVAADPNEPEQHTMF